MRWKILSRSVADNPDSVLRILLANRGLKRAAQQQEFLAPRHPDKFVLKEVGLSPVQIKKAVVLVKKAIKNKEKIAVYGDYDPDGVCATAIIWEMLDRLGADAVPFIPTRDEGYGLKVDRLNQLAEQKVKMVITADQGIVHHSQVKHARKIGLKVIVTDHHQPGKSIPRADAVIHTVRLSGCGVAWFFARRLGAALKSKKPPLESLDLAALGTITDMVPLTGANRSLVKFGLPILAKTSRVGLRALFQLAGINKTVLSTYEVGFVIGPRLNAVGRLSDPLDSLRLVCTRDKSRAALLAEKINRHNTDRQKLMEQAFAVARQNWLETDGESSLIFVHDRSFHLGIIGLVASKLVEEFYRPAVVVASRDDISKGSARSIDGFNIIEAIRNNAEFLSGHGGHPKAAGFVIKTAKIEIFKKRLTKHAETVIDPASLTPSLKIDMELGLDQLTLPLLEIINRLQPFGEANREPVFATKNLMLADARLIGAENKHLKITVRDQHGLSFSAIGFGMGRLFPDLTPNGNIDLAYNLIADDWNGRRHLQLKLKDINIKQST